MTDIKGKCLCGAVSFTADVKTTDLDACHCTMCRQWTGGPYLCVGHDGDVSFTGRENITVYTSSAWAERAFCKHCGTALYWHMRDGPHYAISAGTIEDQAALKLARQIFIDQKPGYYDFANQTPTLTGEELFAAFNAGKTT